jgi:PPOX class probable FMN-dependent enzyme
MATTSASGRLDVSPKGDPAGFVRVADANTLHFPDRLGNNRIDGMQNIIETGRIGLIFLVPGIRETLRINGLARISADPALLESHAHQGKLPRTVIVITVEEVFMHCAKAVVRSRIWDPAAQIDRNDLPSMGTILAAHTAGIVDQCEYDENHEANIKATLY